MTFEYETFEDWFNEIEITAERSDRFYMEFKEYGGLDYQRYQRAVEWLRAAFECGRAVSSGSE